AAKEVGRGSNYGRGRGIGKSEEEKRPTDFQADDDAIVMGKSVTMKKALKT
ncbi:hypothetical protein Tco_1248882, partial [Tanacetum coccineum]